MSSENFMPSSEAAQQVGEILDTFVLSFYLESLRNGSQSAICLPFALDAGLALIGRGRLSEGAYKSHRRYFASSKDLSPAMMVLEEINEILNLLVVSHN